MRRAACDRDENKIKGEGGFMNKVKKPPKTVDLL